MIFKRGRLTQLLVTYSIQSAKIDPRRFAGDVATGDSSTFRGSIGDAVTTLLPPTIAEEFADAIAALPVATK